MNRSDKLRRDHSRPPSPCRSRRFSSCVSSESNFSSPYRISEIPPRSERSVDECFDSPATTFKTGDRVLLDVENHSIGQGTVIDPQYNPYYVLVRWDEDSFNSDISRLLSTKNNYNLSPDPVFGAAVPKSKLVLLGDSSSEDGEKFLRPKSVATGRKAAPERKRLPRSDLSPLDVNRGPDRHRRTEQGENSKPRMNCNHVGSAYLPRKESVQRRKSSISASATESASRRKLFERESFLKEALRRKSVMSDRLSGENRSNSGQSLPKRETVPSPKPSPLHSAESGYKGESEESFVAEISDSLEEPEESCTGGHVMVRRANDTYEGDGVECDECRRSDIHLAPDGFFHCSVCEKVDLCAKCAGNTIKRNEKPEQRAFCPSGEKSTLLEGSASRPGEEEASRGSGDDGGCCSGDDTGEKRRLPEFWFVLLDRKSIESFRREDGEKDEKIQFSLVDDLNKSPEKAESCFAKVILRGEVPNAFTFFVLFEACARVSPRNSTFAHKLALHMRTLEVDPPERTLEALLKVFSGDEREEKAWRERYTRVFKK